MKKVLIRGIEIDLDNLNFRLKKILKERKEEFMFSRPYQDGSKERYTVHVDEKNHTDNMKRDYGDYSEKSTHTDIYSTQHKNWEEHSDYTDSHTDKSYTDYSDVYYDE